MALVNDVEELYQSLLENINQQLSEQGLLIRSGEVNIIGASVIEAKNSRLKKNKEGNNTQDKYANWNVKSDQTANGNQGMAIKRIMNVDEDSFIKMYKITAGNIHDSQMFVS